MGSKPKVVHQDPEGDARRAAEKATADANTKKAMRRTGSSTGSAMSVLGGESDDQQRSNIGSALVNSKYGALFEKKSKLGGG